MNKNSDNIDKMEERYIATMVLHAIGDTIGFKNGEWEFKLFEGKIVNLQTTLEIVYQFISLGGINEINLENWNVSDDTMLHMAIAFSLIDINTTDEKLIDDIKENFVGVYGHMMKDEKAGVLRYIGITTQKYIEQIINEKPDGRTSAYDPQSGGNGASMRTHAIGLAYFGEQNRDKLIDVAIESSRITHNSPIGYLGGLTSALFTAFAIEGIPITSWMYKLMDIIESDKVTKYLRHEFEDEESDYQEFVKFCKKYIDDRFDSQQQPIRTRAQSNLIYRSRYYYENFTADTKGKMIGDSGFSSVIMAYDCLLDCNASWETLIIYSALHWGDSDTVASIACGWFGAVYGMKNIPETNVKHLEFKQRLYDIGKNLYKKFYLGEDLQLVNQIKRSSKYVL
jgi:ADP-ribosylglycohydrolase